MKRTDELPPKPDVQTGEPRPPAAPLVESMGASTNEQDRETNTKSMPSSPDGKGPVLEWFQENRRSGVKSFLIGFFFLVIAGTIKEWSFSWMGVWWLWLFPVGLGIILYLAFRRRVIGAGADWYKSGNHWVDTYDLKSVKIKIAPGRFDLALHDRSGRSVATTCLAIEKNRKLWDLVYNGIIHSAKDHPLETNKAARQYLDLPL